MQNPEVIGLISRGEYGSRFLLFVRRFSGQLLTIQAYEILATLVHNTDILSRQTVCETEASDNGYLSLVTLDNPGETRNTTGQSVCIANLGVSTTQCQHVS